MLICVVFLNYQLSVQDVLKFHSQPSSKHFSCCCCNSQITKRVRQKIRASQGEEFDEPRSLLAFSPIYFSYEFWALRLESSFLPSIFFVFIFLLDVAGCMCTVCMWCVQQARHTHRKLRGEEQNKNNAMMTTPLNTFHLTIYLLSLTSNFLYILAFPSPHISHAGRIVSTCSADCSCVISFVMLFHVTLFGISSTTLSYLSYLP